jgi:hypothetical protein
MELGQASMELGQASMELGQASMELGQAFMVSIITGPPHKNMGGRRIKRIFMVSITAGTNRNEYFS